jgi:aromatic ring-cleaving dioxygenase
MLFRHTHVLSPHRIIPNNPSSPQNSMSASDANVRFPSLPPPPISQPNLHSVPELRIYRLFPTPVGPHITAMFEVNIFTPAQFGAFIPWLVINRGPLSALVHPNTTEEDAERDHTQRATWLGERLPIDASIFERIRKSEVVN